MGGVTTTTTSAGTTIATTTPSSVFDVVPGAGGVGSPFATIITQIVNSKFGSLDATKGPPPHLPLLFVAPKRATS